MQRQEWLIVEFSGAGVESITHLVAASELFEWLEKARDGDVRIAVYEVGKCLLDWS